jgi:hypothetical protein
VITHPTAAELVAAVAAWLPVDGNAPPFAMRVARNALEIAGRDLKSGPAADARAAVRMRALLGQDGTRDELDRALVAAIRGGTIAPDDPALVEHLRLCALDALAVDQPRYAHQLSP